jgi:hypothetical protein
MWPILPILIVAIITVGAVHTIATHYREKIKRRRTREVMERLGLKTWKPLD